MKPINSRKVSSVTAGPATLNSKGMVTITMFIFAALAVVGAASVQAGDSRVYPGSMGIRNAGIGTPGTSSSTIGNPSSNSWLYVDLPIINGSHQGASSGWVRVIDMNTSYDVSRALNSMHRSEPYRYGWWTPAQSSSGTAFYSQIFTFGSLRGSGIAEYYYSMKIPPMDSGNTSYTTFYRVEER